MLFPFPAVLESLPHPADGGWCSWDSRLWINSFRVFSFEWSLLIMPMVLWKFSLIPWHGALIGIKVKVDHVFHPQRFKALNDFSCQNRNKYTPVTISPLNSDPVLEDPCGCGLSWLGLCEKGWWEAVKGRPCNWEKIQCSDNGCPWALTSYNYKST